MFTEAAREAASAAVFVPADKPGDADLFCHCVDLMRAPGPEALGA